METNIFHKSLCDLEEEGKIRLPRLFTGNSDELSVTLDEVFLSKIQETPSGLMIFAKKLKSSNEFDGLVKKIDSKINQDEWQKIKEVLTCRAGKQLKITKLMIIW